MSEIVERFWAKVDKSGECWLWTAATNGKGGYGVFTPVKREGQKLAHRFAYTEFIAPIPDGLEIDHLCRVRLCVRPDHLEAVTRQENIARAEMDWRPWQAAGVAKSSANRRNKTHCKRGHEFTPENTRLVPNGRNCRKCAVIHTIAYQIRRGLRAA